MKNSFKAAVFFGFAVLLVQDPTPAQAGGIPIIWQYGAEKTIKVADFPHTQEFRNQQGQHIDAGYIYKQFCIFWIPLWNYEERWCGYIEGSTQYQILTKAELDEVARSAGITLPSAPSLPVWDAFGGKLCLAGLLAGYFVIAGASRSARATTPAPRKTTFPQPMPRPPAPMSNPPPGYYATAAPPPPPPPVPPFHRERTQPSMPPPPPSSSRPPPLPRPATQEFKCSCAHCGQKLAFDSSMLHTTIQCPACKKQTTLVHPA